MNGGFMEVIRKDREAAEAAFKQHCEETDKWFAQKCANMEAEFNQHSDEMEARFAARMAEMGTARRQMPTIRLTAAFAAEIDYSVRRAVAAEAGYKIEKKDFERPEEVLRDFFNF